jgi:hypothetical protein
MPNSTLANRVPAALTLKIKQAPELFPTGISEVDAALGGGLPRGSITEVAGAASLTLKYQVRLPSLRPDWRRHHRKMRATEMATSQDKTSRANGGHAHRQWAGSRDLWTQILELARPKRIKFCRDTLVVACGIPRFTSRSSLNREPRSPENSSAKTPTLVEG